MAFLDPVNTIATKKIVPGVVDNVFKNSPLLAFLRKNSLKRYEGGPSWQENFLYGKLAAVAYSPGDTFDLSQRQVATGGTVTPRYYAVPVSAYIEKIKIEMNGPQAVFDYVDLLMQVAALSMSAKLSIAAWRHGQNIASGDRSKEINGLDEALNEGTVNGWTGDTFTSYLTITRTDVSGALNSPMTNPSASIAGPISYPTLEQAWNSVVVGQESPDLMVTTNNGMSYIKMAFQGQQRFESTQGEFGFQGIKFNGSTILQDQYCPGAAGVNDADLGNYLASAGETLWFLNTKYLNLYVSTDSLFGFGFTGFMPAQDSSVVAGRYHATLNLTCTAPRYSRVLYAITG